MTFLTSENPKLSITQKRIAIKTIRNLLLLMLAQSLSKGQPAETRLPKDFCNKNAESVGRDDLEKTRKEPSKKGMKNLFAISTRNNRSKFSGII
jgi:hypothetical protein